VKAKEREDHVPRSEGPVTAGFRLPVVRVVPVVIVYTLLAEVERKLHNGVLAEKLHDFAADPMVDAHQADGARPVTFSDIVLSIR
jgi:hypothetical protein